MKNIPKCLIVSPSFFLLSCTKVVEVDLETAEPKLVIDASIDWVRGTTGNEQKIKLSTTTGYYSTIFPTVSGADIVITNSANTAFSFIETPGTGEYTCSNFHPVIGEIYTLKVVLNGEIYTATETCIGVPNIENNITQIMPADLEVMKWKSNTITRIMAMKKTTIYTVFYHLYQRFRIIKPRMTRTVRAT